MAIMLAAIALTAMAQQRKVQNKPYIDLRPLHFGIHVGLNMQDIEMKNLGPQMLLLPDMAEPTEQLVLCDADTWNPGFSVGVLADVRLGKHFSARLSPAMHFGAKHLTFVNQLQKDAQGRLIQETQDMKSTYVSLPLDIKFAAPRWNNHRPYIMAGINPMINLTGGDQDMVRIKKYDTMLEVGLGCDFYLPFFKLIPELKFCFGLSDVLDKNHINELRDTNLRAYAGSVSSAQSKMFVLTFYFE